MKCLYYLAPTLESAGTISDDLHEIGVDDWYIHVVSKDEAGLRKKKLHSSNYLETRDFLGSGFAGAAIGFIAGFLISVLLKRVDAFGPDAPGYAYILFWVVATMFGAWVGGLHGARIENRKLARFQNDIMEGKHLFLIYAKEDQIGKITDMMRSRHPESKHAGTDEHFVSPFGDVDGENHPG